MHNKTPAERAARVPTIHIISDSIGETAQVVARAAAAQFGVTSPHLEIFSKVKSFEEVRGYLLEHARHHEEVLGDDRMLVMYTLVNADIREPLQGFLAEHPNIVAVDVLTAAVAAVSEMSGMEPVGKPGMLRVVDHNYFKRIGALEFTIAHDDGQNPEDLTKADIVLLGVSRSSKTPLSIYLAQQGLRVANVPLDPTTEPPSQIYDVDRTRLFGLMITPEVLLDIRRKRIKKAAGKAGGGQFAMLAKNYADPARLHRRAHRGPRRRGDRPGNPPLLRAQPPLQYRHHRLAAAVPPPAGCSTLFPMLVKKVAETAFAEALRAGSGQKGAAGCISFTLGSIGVLIARS